jgi:hypothetical protein
MADDLDFHVRVAFGVEHVRRYMGRLRFAGALPLWFLSTHRRTLAIRRFLGLLWVVVDPSSLDIEG